MLVTAVESTTLRTIAYDEVGEVLQLEFCSRAIYQYFDVPAAVHQGLLDAQSKGGYFNRVIRRDFRYCQVPDCNLQKASGVAVARRPQ